MIIIIFTLVLSCLIFSFHPIIPTLSYPAFALFLIILDASNGGGTTAQSSGPALPLGEGAAFVALIFYLVSSSLASKMIWVYHKKFLSFSFKERILKMLLVNTIAMSFILIVFAFVTVFSILVVIIS